VGFGDSYGNAGVVKHLRESTRAERFPHSLILAALMGADKYTPALKLARADLR